MWNSLLRSAMCSVWAIAIFMGIYYLTLGFSAQPGSVDETRYLARAVISGSVALVGMLAHAVLIIEHRGEHHDHHKTDDPFY